MDWKDGVSVPIGSGGWEGGGETSFTTILGWAGNSNFRGVPEGTKTQWYK